MKEIILKYSGKTDQVVNKETGAVESESVAFSGEVVALLPTLVEEAKEKYGEEVTLSKIIQAVKIDMQRICRAFEGDDEKAQAAINSFIPGVSRERSSDGTSVSAASKAIKELPKEKQDEIFAKIAEMIAAAK